MNGITGTSMPYFKRALESEKIWDVSNYVGVYFIGYTDADIEPKGIDAAYEGQWFNPYATPQEAEKMDVLPFTTIGISQCRILKRPSSHVLAADAVIARTAP
jgi:hypothetical protein